MGQKLGICVATKNNMAHVLGLAEAAKRAGKVTDIFLTGDGVHLTQDPRFSQLLDAGRVGICEVGYLACGYKDKRVQGLNEKHFVNQMRNAEMVATCDRYLIL